MTEEKHISELTSENSFWKLYKLTRKIPTSKDNLYLYWIFLSLFTFIALLTNSTLENELKWLTDSTENLISWSISILGFTLAGYSIFASLTDKSLQLKLASNTEPKTGINLLKHTHCLFLKTLIELLLIILIVYFLRTALKEEMVVGLVKDFKFDSNKVTLLLSFIRAVVDSLFVFMLLLCKSFVYNIYHTIMVSIRWHAKNTK